MNKKILNLTLILMVFVGIALTTQTTYAAHTPGYNLQKQTVSGSDRYYITYNGSQEGISNSSYFEIDFNVVEISDIVSVTIVVENPGLPNVTYTHNGTPINEVYLSLDSSGIEFDFEGNAPYLDVLVDQSTKIYFTNIQSFDDIRPAISGEENFVTSVDDAKPVSYFQQYLTAIDETDGDISSRIYVVSDNYTTNKAVLGTYKVVFGVKDAALNESTLEVNISVVDVTRPVITGNASKVQVSYTQTWNIQNFKTTLSAIDNYATLTNNAITVKTDNYTQNKTNLGTYTVVFAVLDPSGNEGLFTKEIEIIDDVAPVFSGPTVITKPATQVLTVNEIKAQLFATDAKEGNRTAQITVYEDNYTGRGNKVGNYTITFQVEDSKGNKATHVVTVSVQDNIPPVWYIQDGVTFKIVPPATLTRQQIIDLLVATNQFSVNATTQINFLVDEYSGNETTPGVYTVSLGYADTAGNEGVHTLAITVLEDESTNPIVVDPDGKLDIVGFLTSPTGLFILGVAAAGLLFVFSKSNKKSKRR